MAGNIFVGGNLVVAGNIFAGTGNSGLILQNWTQTSGWGAIYSSAVTPENLNYILRANNTYTMLNAQTGGQVEFLINGSQWAGIQAGTTSYSSVSSQAFIVYAINGAGSGGIGVQGDSYFANNVGIGSNVGVGTSSITTGNAVVVYGGNVFVAGNIQISNTSTQLGGIQFADGTFLRTASGGSG